MIKYKLQAQNNKLWSKGTKENLKKLDHYSN